MAIVTDGLIAEYVGKLGESGTAPGNNTDTQDYWNDIVGSGDLSPYGFAWTTLSGWKGAGTAGDPYCIQNDADSYWYRAITLDVDGSAWSVECWAYLPTATTAERTLWSFRQADGSPTTTVYAAINHYSNDSGNFFFGWENNAGGFKYITETTIDARNAWAHVVVTWDGTTGRLYVNGTQASSTLTTPGTSDIDRWELSHDVYGVEWTGAIATARIYTQDLSSSEVAQNYAAGVLAASTDAAAVSDMSFLLARGIGIA